MSGELAVVVHVDRPEGEAWTVSGRIESPYGSDPFAGWLDLLSRLEAIVDQARDQAM